MILGWIREAVAAGARKERACEAVGLSVRTVQRWKLDPDGEDRREGPHTRPPHALSEKEQQEVLAAIHRPEHHDASPKTIVARLADRGEYLASESTMYRLLRAAGELVHRGRAKAPVHRETPSLRATGPNQVWSWDITYLLSMVRGVFFYLYLIEDIWSRRIMGWAVHTEESQEHAASLIAAAASAAKVDPGTLTLHADNGGPMRGGTMLTKLYDLGIRASFSRPRVSDDNPFSESLFRTLKYVPQFPRKPFENVAAARAWVEEFVRWYNGTHLHSGIGFVTPESRHRGRDVEQLVARRAVYEAACAKHPGRWSGAVRSWSRPEEVTLNAKDHQGRTRQPVSSPGAKVDGVNARASAKRTDEEVDRQGPIRHRRSTGPPVHAEHPATTSSRREPPTDRKMRQLS
jgi:transposase InsO family protein